MKRMVLGGVGLAALLGVAGAAMAQDPGAPPPPPMGGRMHGGGMNGMLEQRFAEMDANHDGVVTRPEYDAYRARMRADRAARMQAHRDRQSARMDAGKDAALSRQGYDAPPPSPPPAGGPALGYDPTGGAGAPPPPPPGGPGSPGRGGRGPDWFDRADANHDGKVTLAEAQAAMQAMMAERRGMRGPGGDMPPPPPPQ